MLNTLNWMKSSSWKQISDASKPLPKHNSIIHTADRVTTHGRRINHFDQKWIVRKISPKTLSSLFEQMRPLLNLNFSVFKPFETTSKIFNFITGLNAKDKDKINWKWFHKRESILFGSTDWDFGKYIHYQSRDSNISWNLRANSISCSFWITLIWQHMQNFWTLVASCLIKFLKNSPN